MAWQVLFNLVGCLRQIRMHQLHFGPQSSVEFVSLNDHRMLDDQSCQCSLREENPDEGCNIPGARVVETCHKRQIIARTTQICDLLQPWYTLVIIFMANSYLLTASLDSESVSSSRISGFFYVATRTRHGFLYYSTRMPCDQDCRLEDLASGQLGFQDTKSFFPS